MIAKVETAIWLALKGRVESLGLGYPFAWVGEKFEPPHNDSQLLPFVRVGRVSVPPSRVLIKPGRKQIRTGVLMLTLVYPMGQETKVYDQLGATIAEHFREGTEMRYESVCVSVEFAPHVQEGYQDNGYWTVPVRIPWRSFS